MKLLFVIVALFALQGGNGFDFSKMLDKLQPVAEKIRDYVDANKVKTAVNDTTDANKVKTAVNDNTDANKVKTAVNDNTDKLISELKTFGDKINNELKSHHDYVSDKVKQMTEHLHTVQKKGAKKEVDQLQKDFNTAYEATVDQLQTFFKKREGDAKDLEATVKKYSESLMENVLKIGKDVQERVKEATTSKP